MGCVREHLKCDVIISVEGQMSISGEKILGHYIFNLFLLARIQWKTSQAIVIVMSVHINVSSIASLALA